MSIQPGTPPEIDPGRRGQTQPSRPVAGVGMQRIDPSRFSGSTAMGGQQFIGGVNPNSAQIAAAAGDLVYWGNDPKTNKPVFRNKTDAKQAWIFLPDKTRQRLTQRMNDVFGEGKWTNQTLQYYWGQAVDGGNYALYAENQLLGVPDVFDMILGERSQAAEGGGGGGGGVSRTTQMRLTDPQGARALIDNALAQYLGRKATAKEQKAFLKALNVQEAKYPTVTTSVSGGGGASVVTTGGFNPSTFAEEYAQGMQGSAEFQAATTFLDAFIGALRPVV